MFIPTAQEEKIRSYAAILADYNAEISNPIFTWLDKFKNLNDENLAENFKTQTQTLHSHCLQYLEFIDDDLSFGGAFANVLYELTKLAPLNEKEFFSEEKKEKYICPISFDPIDEKNQFILVTSNYLYSAGFIKTLMASENIVDPYNGYRLTKKDHEKFKQFIEDEAKQVLNQRTTPANYGTVSNIGLHGRQHNRQSRQGGDGLSAYICMNCNIL